MNYPTIPFAIPRFSGADIDRKRDTIRLNKQIGDIFDLMKDGKERTLEQIAAQTGHGEASVSAQLRNLRKKRFGGHAVGKRHITNGLYTYWLTPNPDAL